MKEKNFSIGKSILLQGDYLETLSGNILLSGLSIWVLEVSPVQQFSLIEQQV
jgi:hypothetical protein